MMGRSIFSDINIAARFGGDEPIRSATCRTNITTALPRSLTTGSHQDTKPTVMETPAIAMARDAMGTIIPHRRATRRRSRIRSAA